MADTDQRVVEEMVHEGEALTTGELFDIMERYQDDRPGVPHATIDAYAQELKARADSDVFAGVVDERLTESADWLDDERLYELDDGRASTQRRGTTASGGSATPLPISASSMKRPSRSAATPRMAARTPTRTGSSTS